MTHTSHFDLGWLLSLDLLLLFVTTAGVFVVEFRRFSEQALTLRPWLRRKHIGASRA